VPKFRKAVTGAPLADALFDADGAEGVNAGAELAAAGAGVPFEPPKRLEELLSKFRVSPALRSGVDDGSPWTTRLLPINQTFHPFELSIASARVTPPRATHATTLKAKIFGTDIVSNLLFGSPRAALVALFDSAANGLALTVSTDREE
jgi:hypothetical protein